MKQINVKLLAILFISTVLTLAGSFFLYRFQKDRNADGLIVRADEKQQAGEYGEAVKLYARYLALRKDDNEQYAKLALAMKDNVEQMFANNTLDGKTFSSAYAAVEQALRKNPDNLELRETAIDFTMKFRRFTDAKNHLELMMQQNPQPKWKVKMAECMAVSGEHEKSIPLLAPVVGFDYQTREFNSDPADAEEDAYSLLATVYMYKLGDIGTGNQVIDRMVQVKPDSHQARLLRASYYRSMRRPEYDPVITSDLDRALQLAPGDFNVLISSTENALFLKDLDKSKKLAQRCIEKFPEKVEGYKAAANWALLSRSTATAIKFLDRGLQKRANDPSLLWMRANIELDQKNYDALAVTREQLVEAKYPPSMLKFLDARREFSAAKWLLASRKLEEVRPEISQQKPQWLAGLDSNLATCYQQMGQHDKRLKPLQRILDANGDNIPARWQKIQALLALNQQDKVIVEYGIMKQQMAGKNIKMTPELLVAGLQVELMQQEQRPEDDRNYSQADVYARQLTTLGLHKNGATAKLIETMYVKAGRQQEADKFVKELRAAAPNDLSVIVRDVNDAAKNDGIEAAIALLEKNKSKFTDSLNYRLLRCELLARHVPDQAREQLSFLEADMGTFPEERQVSLVRGMGRVYLLMGDFKETRRLWEKLANQRPNDFAVRLSMFELAMEDGDEDGMKSAQKKLAALLGQDSAEWQFTEAARITWRARNGKDDPPQIDTALGLVEEAISRRDSWETLYRLKGEILVMRGQSSAAIEALEKVISLGVAHPNVYKQLARLHFKEGNTVKAGLMLKKLPKQLWDEQDRRIEMDLLAKRGELPEELPYDKESKDASHHVWIAKMLSNAKRFDQAEEAFDRGLALDPEDQNLWLAKVSMQVMAEEEDKAREVIAAAELKLPQKDTARFLGQSYTILREFDEAAIHFEDAYNQNPEDQLAIQALAETLMKTKDNDRATELIDKLLVGAVPNSESTVIQMWARRSKAQLLAGTGSYHDFTKALEVIGENAPQGEPLSPADMVLWARLSSVRPEGYSRQQAIRKFESVKDQRDLVPLERRTLADLYNKQDRWTDCKSQMLDLLADNPEDISLLDPWLRWLLDHDELKSAKKWVQKCPPGSIARLRTEAMLDVRAGNSKTAVQRLNSLVPGDLPEKDAGRLKIVATILEEMAEYDTRIHKVSMRVWRRYMKFRPQDALSFSAFLGRRGGEHTEEALRICGRAIQKGEYETSLQLAVAILRHNREENSGQFEKFESVVRGWFETAMETNPDNASFLIQRAEFEDVIGNSAKAEKWLRKYLDTAVGVTPLQKAVVANNLAYMLALRGEKEESYKLSQDAMRTLGPTADLRDTLGMIYLARGETQNAIREFEAAIGDGGVTSFKFVHLAMANEAAEDYSASATAVLRAFEMGLKLPQLSTMERERFGKLLETLKENDAITDSEIKTAMDSMSGGK